MIPVIAVIDLILAPICLLLGIQQGIILFNEYKYNRTA